MIDKIVEEKLKILDKIFDEFSSLNNKLQEESSRVFQDQSNVNICENNSHELIDKIIEEKFPITRGMAQKTCNKILRNREYFKRGYLYALSEQVKIPVVSKSFTCSKCIWYSSANQCRTCDNGSNFEIVK